MKTWRHSSTILHLIIGWSRVVSFMPDVQPRRELYNALVPATILVRLVGHIPGPVLGLNDKNAGRLHLLNFSLPLQAVTTPLAVCIKIVDKIAFYAISSPSKPHIALCQEPSHQIPKLCPSIAFRD
jgi:hypothetical protein